MSPTSRLTHALRSAQIGVWEIDLGTLTTVLDEIAEALYGFAPGSFPGTQQAATDRIHPDDLQLLMRERARALATRTDLHLDYRILLPDGRTRWVSGTGQGQYDEQGRPQKISGILIDITARKEAEAERERATRLAQSQREELARQGELLRIIADHVPAALIYLDAEERFRFANRFYREHYGRAGAGETGMSAREVLDGAAYARMAPLFRRAMQGERVVFEGEGRKDHWISATFVPHLDAEGRVLGASVLSEDLTQRRRDERRLRESERQLRLLADTIPQIVWVVSPSGELEYINERWYEYTGLSREDAASGDWLSFVHPEDVPRVLAQHRSSMGDGQPLHLEYRLRRADGVYRWHLARSVFVCDEEGKVLKRYGTATDIHAQKMLEAQQRTLTDAFGELMSAHTLAPRLERSARLAQQLFGGAVLLHLKEGDSLRLAALADPDPTREAILRELDARFPPSVEDRIGPAAVLRSGVALLSGAITQASLHAAARGPEHLALLKQLGLRSTLSLPLVGSGGTVGVLSILSDEGVLDQTDLARAEELARYISWAVENAQLFAAQQEALALLQTVLRAAPVGLVFYDRALRFAQLNEAAAEMIGIASSEEAIGKTQWEVMPQVAPVFAPLLEQVLRTGEALRDREVVVEVDGEPRSRLVSYFPVRAQSPEGAILGVGAVVMDITEARAVQTRLEAAIRTRDEFLATLSHELRTPLTAILGYANMLRTGILPKEKVARAVEVIERNARSQARLVEDLLDASRIVTGRMRLELKPTALEPLIGNVVDSLRPAAAAKEIELTVRCEPVPPMLADPDRLQQVIWNLLSNSIKFTPERGQVAVALSTRKGQVRIAVKDTGIGIRRDFLPHVFERFRQADASSTRAHGGLGLGLAIVKNLVELHGGGVEVQSEGAGRGTEITVTLPFLAPAAASPEPEEADGWKSPAQLRAERPGPDVGATASGPEVGKPASGPEVGKPGSGPEVGKPGSGLEVGRFSSGLDIGATGSGRAVGPMGSPRDVRVDGTAPEVRSGGTCLAGGQRETQLTPDLGGARVLVVDDERETREHLSALLRRHNAHVRAAASAQEALEQLARAPADLLLSDLAMSPVDGYTLVRRLRRLPVHQGGSIPAIALSALGRTEETKEALAAGFDAHLRKPVEPSELLETLAAALGGHPRA